MKRQNKIFFLFYVCMIGLSSCSFHKRIYDTKFYYVFPTLENRLSTIIDSIGKDKGVVVFIDPIRSNSIKYNSPLYKGHLYSIPKFKYQMQHRS